MRFVGNDVKKKVEATGAAATKCGNYFSLKVLWMQGDGVGCLTYLWGRMRRACAAFSSRSLYRESLTIVLPKSIEPCTTLCSCSFSRIPAAGGTAMLQTSLAVICSSSPTQNYTQHTGSDKRTHQIRRKGFLMLRNWLSFGMWCEHDWFNRLH